ncbi:hypothetical protein BDK51DRAFT_29527 [Blyttiomyces helicus]|uniref:Uncharacterized protein n=1 Tax=Blyttiomyces helicus TaxID=388810 RepID=A0A4P9WNQ1_9FUNG|nr:hypothetical protein BDK51DRAFT_29527 [Blyttiomyces helicus]|eukprot:RKO93915.1 hypothetical protein BDK51DRAFT_29527 [Blyttiomyces helicus]
MENSKGGVRGWIRNTGQGVNGIGTEQTGRTARKVEIMVGETSMSWDWGTPVHARRKFETEGGGAGWKGGLNSGGMGSFRGCEGKQRDEEVGGEGWQAKTGEAGERGGLHSPNLAERVGAALDVVGHGSRKWADVRCGMSNHRGYVNYWREPWCLEVEESDYAEQQSPMRYGTSQQRS